MNLLIIEPIGDAFGHFGIHTAKLAQQLAIRGHEVTVCTNRLEVSKFLTETPKFRLIEVEGGRLGFEEFERQATTRRGRYWYGYFRNSWKIANAGLELCRRERFDGIYMTDVEFAMAALSLKRHAKHIPPVILQVNASNFSFAEFPGNVVKKTYKTLQREIFRKVIGKEITAFSILGDWHRDRLRRQLRIGEDFPIELIHDGGGKFENQIEKSAARRQLGIDYSGDVFVFLGILRNDKGLEALAQAMRLLDRKNREYRLIIAGFPLDYTESQLREMFSLDTPGNRVAHHHLDYVEEARIPYYYFAADCLLLPYNNNYKGSSGPLMKGACTFGLPVVASDVSEMGVLTKKHGLGFTAIPGQAESLADAMEQFLRTNPAERAAIMERAYALGGSNSWPDMARRYEEVFLKCSDGAVSSDPNCSAILRS